MPFIEETRSEVNFSQKIHVLTGDVITVKTELCDFENRETANEVDQNLDQKSTIKTHSHIKSEEETLETHIELKTVKRELDDFENRETTNEAERDVDLKSIIKIKEEDLVDSSYLISHEEVNIKCEDDGEQSTDNRGITLKEALNIAYEEIEDGTEVSAIYIEPPDSNVMTDEDSADEDEAGLADNPNIRQLCLGAEIVMSNKTRIGGTEEDPIIDKACTSKAPNTSMEPNSTLPLVTSGLSIKIRPEKLNFCLLGDLEPNRTEFPEGNYSRYASLSCVDIFELFFSDDLNEEILRQTNKYALFKNNPSPNISIEEFKVFLAILILSGYNNLPSKRSYWEAAKDMRNEMAVEAMRRDRFLQICRGIHFADNNSIDVTDKMYKLRSVTDSLKKKMIEHFVPEQNLSYDESMIRYYGRHGCKQFIRGKPVRFGYKMWSLNTPAGYMINFEIHQGKNPRSNSRYEDLYGTAAAPLVQMIEELGHKKKYKYNFFFDNLFTGANLLCTLKENGYGATGTIRDNRMPKECPLEGKSQFSKTTRGTISSSLERTSGIIYVRWMDNTVVTLASTQFGVAPVTTVERFSRQEKKNILVPRPDIVMQYNKNMGGTDLMESNVSWFTYRTRSEKIRLLATLSDQAPKTHYGSDIESSPCPTISINASGFSDLDKDPTYDRRSDLEEPEEPVEKNNDKLANICQQDPEHIVDNLGLLKTNGEKRKGNKKKDFCMFCECYVLNFARHVLGVHSLEKDIQIIKSIPPKDNRRKSLLDDLRKKGNFLNSDGQKKPVRQSTNNKTLPCTNCLGFFSTKQLWRHRKKCMGPNADKHHQSNAQSILHQNVLVDKQLKEEVFPRMRPDEISSVAKSDILICSFGARYFKSKRGKHFINVTSRKMRELARLLIEIQKLKPNVKNLFESLKPINFGLLVAATKNVAQYNEESGYYESASTALNLGMAIKQCCQIAILFVAAEAEAELQTLIQLIDSEWKLEISAQASNDLNMKKWNKISMVPLASDLKCMNNYLISKADLALNQLQVDGENRSAYITLLETVFCRTLLLNRRPPGELQRLPLRIYKECNVNPNYEEFLDIISASEKVLLRRFKRIVIRGKRGRGGPVLFSDDIQTHIKELLKFRPLIVNKKNPYLFGNPTTVQPICGYKVINKYAKLCGAKHPQALTATRLRKHLATLTQVLNMSENDIEQLANFMGHTVNVHRLPDDVFETAKISKLLLLMEKGEAAQHKGKSLDEINLDLNVDINDSDSDEEQPFNYQAEPFQSKHMETIADHFLAKSSPALDETTIDSPEEKKKAKRRVLKAKRVLVAWTEGQKNIVRSFFKKHIKNRQPPKKLECFKLKEKHPVLLANKSWLKIKVFVQNEYVKLKRRN